MFRRKTLAYGHDPCLRGREAAKRNSVRTAGNVLQQRAGPRCAGSHFFADQRTAPAPRTFPGDGSSGGGSGGGSGDGGDDGSDRPDEHEAAPSTVSTASSDPPEPMPATTATRAPRTGRARRRGVGQVGRFLPLCRRWHLGQRVEGHMIRSSHSFPLCFRSNNNMFNTY